MALLYETEEEILRTVRGFETCQTPAGDFHHREHLTVAVWYLQTLSPDETVAAMRTALLRFVDHHGVDRKKYSEEVTVFWVDAIASALEEMGSDAPLLAKCNQIISRFSATTRTPAAPVATEE